jgi:hypothetical protein
MSAALAVMIAGIAVALLGGRHYREEVCGRCGSTRELEGYAIGLGSWVRVLRTDVIRERDSQAFSLVLLQSGHEHEWRNNVVEFVSVMTKSSSEAVQIRTELAYAFERDEHFRKKVLRLAREGKIEWSTLAAALSYDLRDGGGGQAKRSAGYKAVAEAVGVRYPPRESSTPK